MPRKIGAGILACFLFPMAVISRDTGPLRDAEQVSRPQKPDKAAKRGKAEKPDKTGKPGKTSAKTARGSHKPNKVQYGTASFYANKFEGRKTYTDEIFSQKKLTAASNTLPMHTWVRVTNLRNHLSVVLRINDKMHPRNKRLIDLSHAAAERLGYASRGLTRVKVEVLGKKKPSGAGAELASKQE
ncbi:MAG TPA: septal ring lytic transglycosylase RlpA family protein [Puia sp.]|nr:septal ring lytic transglycosylase RlpA family protein [Puia sp.]